MKILNTIAVVSAAFCVGAQVVSVKSPDGKNEIRLDTEPVLSYSVYRSGIERVSSTPMAMEFEGKGVLGGASAKIASIDTVTLKGIIPTPIYKKAFIDEAANRTTVSFDGNWRVVLIARNDGVAYRFETEFQGQVKVLKETAGLTVPNDVASIYAAYCRDRGDPLQCSWESIYTTVTNATQLADKGQVVYLPLVMKYSDGSVMSVSESDLLDYPGWNMKRAAGDTTALVANMARYPTKVEHRNGHQIGSPERPLRHIRVTERADYLAETAGSRTYPWRVSQFSRMASSIATM